MNLILHKILATQDLAAWSRIRKEFFESPYVEIYLLIDKFYRKFNKIPSFDELEVVTRNEKHLNYIRALKEVNVPEDLDVEIIIQALINQYAQKEVLESLSGYLDGLVFKDVGEIIEDLSSIAVRIEEQTDSSEQVVLMNDFTTIDESAIFSRIPLGLNNTFDQHSLGMAPSEMMMLGGYRGSGKSVVCANIVCNQFTQGNSALYFSIEMRGRELFQRYLSILSGVPQNHIRSGKLSLEEQVAIANTRAAMTEDNSQDLLEKFAKDRDFIEFENKLVQRPLKADNRIITIDNPTLSIANIDATIHTFKSRHEDKLKVVVVDYINQITAKDAYHWDIQIEMSKKLKALARKYEVVMVTPYQISEDGKVRFSKGILDSPDWAFNMSPVKNDSSSLGAIEFECKKSRNDREINFASSINWDTLRISPHEDIPFAKDTMMKKKKEKEIEFNPKTDDDVSPI